MRPSLSPHILSVVALGLACTGLVSSAVAQVPTRASCALPADGADEATIDVFFHPAGLPSSIGLVIPNPRLVPGKNPQPSGNGDPGGGDPPTYPGGDPDGGDPGGGDPGSDPPGVGTPPPTNHHPEPATLISALLGAGTLGLFGWRRRRQG